MPEDCLATVHIDSHQSAVRREDRRDHVTHRIGQKCRAPLLKIPEPRAFSWLASREYLAVRRKRQRIDRGLAQRKCRLALTGCNVPKMHAAGEPTRCESFTVGREGEAEEIDGRHVDFASRLFVLEIPDPNAMDHSSPDLVKDEPRRAEVLTIGRNGEIPQQFILSWDASQDVDRPHKPASHGLPKTDKAVALGGDRGRAVTSEINPGNPLGMTSQGGAEAHVELRRRQSVDAAIQPWRSEVNRGAPHRPPAARGCWAAGA